MLQVILMMGACSGEDSASAVSPAGGELPMEARSTRVEVAQIQKGDLTQTLSLPGEVEGSRDAVLASSLGGLVEEVYVSMGQSVREGELLAQVDLSLLATSYEQADAQASYAEAELRRVEALGNLSAPAQLEAASTQARVARAGREAAGTRLSRAMIRAPFDGVVAEVSIEKGEVLAPGMPAVRVVQLDPIKVTLSVPDRDVVSLEAGLEVEVSVAARPGIRPGTIHNIAPAANMKTRAFPVEILLDNKEQSLLPGMIAQVRVGQARENLLAIPQEFVLSRGGEYGVFLERDRVAHWQPLTLGELFEEQIVVLSGLEEGQRVVVLGHRELMAGDPLVVSREGVCCESGRVLY